MKLKNRRECAGPRGGRVNLPTPCSECVAYRTCAPGAITEPWGCESWADPDGHRALPEVIDFRDVAAADLPPEVAEATFEPDPEPWASFDAGPLFGGRS